MRASVRASRVGLSSDELSALSIERIAPLMWRRAGSFLTFFAAARRFVDPRQLRPGAAWRSFEAADGRLERFELSQEDER